MFFKLTETLLIISLEQVNMPNLACEKVFQSENIKLQLSKVGFFFGNKTQNPQRWQALFLKPRAKRIAPASLARSMLKPSMSPDCGDHNLHKRVGNELPTSLPPDLS